MGYEFDNSTQKIDYGTHVALYQGLDLTVGFWIKFIAGVSDNKIMLGQLDTFSILLCNSKGTATDGFGIIAEHVKGGGFSFGVTCVPGQVDPSFKLNADTWLYFGISRDAGAQSYYSYFGSRAAMIDGPIFTWLPGQEPFPITQPGQGLGPWVVGSQVDGIVMGPAHYWDVPLTKNQHLSMARCILPPEISLVHLLWWTKMREGAIDDGPIHYTPTFAGTPLPLFVPDEGCASFGAGQDYRLYNT